MQQVCVRLGCSAVTRCAPTLLHCYIMLLLQLMILLLFRSN